MSTPPPYPWFRRGLADGPSPQAEAIPLVDRARSEDPALYLPDPDLSHAVNVALVLGMPLLLTGEPGTGKTRLADALANDLACPLHRFDTKSTSAARDLFYTYDALTAFKARDAADPRLFIRYQALGRAILEAFPKDLAAIQPLLPPDGQGSFTHPGAPRRAVVLIDEIDKAPRDFPNDLLTEIDRLAFRVPELQNAGTPGSEAGEAGVPNAFRPIVILTSNSEKGLPDPFLRRCVYYDIPFPDKARMGEIVARRLAGLEQGSPLLTDALDLFYDLRHANGHTRLVKEPSTAELINWIQLLVQRGAKPGQTLRGQPALVRETLSSLVKNKSDRRDALAHAEKWVSGQASGRPG
jgi:MoxR-like ATPase